MVKKKLAYITATPQTYTAFLKSHAVALADEYDITLIANFDGCDTLTGFQEVSTIQAGIRRKISLVHDLQALACLTCIFRRQKFDIIHSVTPKAGLLSSIAGVLARIPNRVHIYTGQVWATHRGLSRWLLKTFDKITLICATSALADSHSQSAFLKTEGFSKPIRVLGNGAISGIDTARFRSDDKTRSVEREKYGFDLDDFVFIFLGRLNRDKGVMDLIAGFERADLAPHCKLLIVGPDEEQLIPEIKKKTAYKAGRIVIAGSTAQPERALNAGDVMCLPSYREGFGMSVLEAAAIGLPTISSRIYGLTDAVVEGVTGVMHEVGNIGEIAKCLALFASDPEDAQRKGEAARVRVVHAFSLEKVSDQLKAFYKEVAKAR